MWLPQQSQLDQVNSPADIQTGSSAAFPQDKHQVTDTAGWIWSLHDDFCNNEPLWRFSIILSTKTREYDCIWQLLQLAAQPEEELPDCSHSCVSQSTVQAGKSQQVWRRAVLLLSAPSKWCALTGNSVIIVFINRRIKWGTPWDNFRARWTELPLSGNYFSTPNKQGAYGN